MDSKSDSKNLSAESWLRYADELGLAPFYLERPVQMGAFIAAPAAPIIAAAHESAIWQAPADDRAASSSLPALVAAVPKRVVETSSVAQKSAASQIFVPQVAAQSLFEERIENDSLDRIRQDITPTCTRCKLHKARKQIVFGVGNPEAQLVFVGEGPGRDEDEQGEPFVGRAGQLLTQMIGAMGLRRQDVYICNVVKCRPPENRLPEKDEIAICSPFLARQLAVINPKVICCLGACSAQTLLNTNQGISRFRGEWFDYRGSKLIATYHPAYLLRNPAAKAEVWKDLQKVMAVLGLHPPKKTKP